MSAVIPKRTKKPAKAAAPAPSRKKIRNAPRLTLKPRVSEKGYAISEQLNTYVFDVSESANKFDISKAVAAQYEVSVENVRIAGVPGKSIRSYRQRGRRSISGRRSDIRKAYVTLKQGDKLPIFAAVEETKAPEDNK